MVKPLILLVEDNPDILKYIQLVLEHNEYRTISAENGRQGLQILSKFDDIPDLIISDILMPEMDGYEFFNNISTNEKYSHVPFIFLTALDSPEDVRLGKALGVDDYLTKPINEEDLLATISGKINRNKRSTLINENIKEYFFSQDTDLFSYLSKEDTKKVVLLEVQWDDITGPNLIKYFPDDLDYPFPIKEIGKQLFHSISSIYGSEKITSAKGILINIENFKISGYAFFDSFPDKSTRAGKRNYMFAVLAPNISYLHSIQINVILKKMSRIYKQKKEWDLATYWEKILNLLSKPPI